MPIGTVEKTVDGHNVKIVTFSAGRGFKIKIKVLKTLLPVFTTLFGSGKLEGRTFSAKDFEAISVALDPDKVYDLMLELLSSTWVDGKEAVKSFDDLFAGNYVFAYKLAYEVIQANNFLALGDIGNLLNKAEN